MGMQPVIKQREKMMKTTTNKLLSYLFICLIAIPVQGQRTIGMKALPGAEMLFDGSKEMLHEKWTYWEGPRLKAKLPIKWELLDDPLDEGKVMSSNDPAAAGGLYGAADIVSKKKFRDFRLHVEFLIANEGGNSGVYLQNRYEIQVLDGDSTTHGLAAIINETESPYYAYRGLGKWNSYDVQFKAARFKEGKKVSKAQATLYFNGVKVHQNKDINQVWGGPNSGLDGGNEKGKGITDRPGGIKLQAEGHDVLYRNIWIKELELGDEDTDFELIEEKANLYPGENWVKVDKPEDLGYSTAKLKEAEAYANTIHTAATTIIVDGKILYEWGEVKKKYMTHSIRKSFLSALYGNYVENGLINLDQTMADLGINDEPPLSEEELKATLRDCLKARSAIYHPALYESQGMKDLKPERHSMRAGTHWYYNNWDFNASGTLFEKLTGKKIFESIEKEIAEPIGMEDFKAEDGWYVNGEASIHPAYPFRISAHDLARFGWLMLNKGMWKGKQIIPANWVEESTAYHSDAALYGSDGYGYMWWVARDHNKYPHLPNVDIPEGSYSARGAGGHYVMIIPKYNMVIVHRVDTDKPKGRVSTAEAGTLFNLILQARE